MNYGYHVQYINISHMFCFFSPSVHLSLPSSPSLPPSLSPSLPLYLPPILSLSPSLPLLPLYLALNHPDAKDSDIQVVRDILVDSLFAVLATAGQCLAIRICIARSITMLFLTQAHHELPLFFSSPSLSFPPLLSPPLPPLLSSPLPSSQALSQ